ncbi:hypothetical protein LVD17_28215 [Fulvivirga ulvae]|uniref:peptidoglycan-binding domain-containing protein n=1 Tax=Fulvivirga ulvae TaxID=2904245 RepID=UPI001F201FF2|nr:hypothetical protein [Fulvivirga ulvae]UII32174.1 hypothetical protein LVD17_28215 [Fulvivirga ulvae]
MKNENFKIDNNLLWIGGGVLVAATLGAGIWYYRKKKREKADDGYATTSSGQSKQTSSGFKCVSNAYPLSYGTCHPDVEILQRALKRKGASLGRTGKNRDGVDGQFGRLTATNAKKYFGKDSFNATDIKNLK